MTADLVFRVVAWGMIAFWILLGALFLVMHPRNIAAEVRRAPGWWAGLLLQALAFVVALLFARPFGAPHPHVPLWLDIALALSVTLIAIASGWMLLDAVRELGKQWGVAARIVSGHELVRTGPFAIVRHPIYSGLFGLLIATAVTFSNWLGVILSVAIYLAGTSMRIRKEERLLRETFGAEFDDYAEEVPALLPGLF